MASPADEDDVPPVFSALLKYGMAGIAAFLVYFLASDVKGKQDEQLRLIRDHTSATATMQNTLDRMDRKQDILIDIARQSCVNAASTFVARQSCWNAGAGR